MTIRARLWLMVTLLLGVVLSGNAFVVLHLETEAINRDFSREAMGFAALAGPLALRAYGELGRTDAHAKQLAGRIGELAAGLPELKGLGLVGPRGNKFLLVHPPGAELALPGPEEEVPPEGAMRLITRGEETFLEVTSPVEGRGPSVLLRLLVSRRGVEARLETLRRVFAVSLGALLVLGAGAAHWLAGRIVGPIEALRDAATRVGEGDLTVRVRETEGGELGELGRAFNTMAGELAGNRRALVERNEAVERAYGELQSLGHEMVRLEKMAAVGRTAAALSHEIDNPIGVILGTAQVLGEEAPPGSPLAEDLALIESESVRLRRIVRDLLDLAKPTPAGEGPVDLRATLEPLLRGMRHHPSFRGVEVLEAWSPGLAPVSVDPDSVKQVVLNLLLNAAKSLDGRGRLGVEGRAEGAWVLLDVWDEGAGVDPACRERIFDPFFTTGAGTGLGLSISRAIVEGDAGTLTLEEREGVGCLFRVRWPRGGEPA